MAHQEHSIKWSALVESLSLVKVGPRGTSQRVTVVRRGDDEASQKRIRHFARTLVAALEDFSTTERSKVNHGTRKQPAVPDRWVPAEEDAIIDPALGEYARVQDWRGPAFMGDHRAVLVMELLNQGSMRTLFRLARLHVFDANYLSYNLRLVDGDTMTTAETRSNTDGNQAEQLPHRLCSPVLGLWHLPATIQTGWSNVWDAALMAYVYYNSTYLLPQLWRDRDEQCDYRNDVAFRTVVEFTTGPRDGDAFIGLHRAFYGDTPNPDPLAPGQGQAARLKEYLAEAWQLLVRCHATVAEAGATADWEQLAIETVERLWRVAA